VSNLAIMRQLSLKVNLRWTSAHETPEANSSPLPGEDRLGVE